MRISFLVAALTAGTALGQVCRDESLGPHQYNYWRNGFPISEIRVPLCEGTIEVLQDGKICVTGRVSYEQIQEAVGRPIFAPAAMTISTTGHLAAGSGNVALGARTGFVYDFVSSYVVDGTSYLADDTMIDNLLAASRGTIDGVCFVPEFARDPENYRISTKTWFAGQVPADELTDANFVFVSKLFVVAQYLEPTMDTSTEFPGFEFSLFNFSTEINFPSWLIALVPGFLGLLGLLRQVLVGEGVFSTAEFPMPLAAPPVAVADIQVDTEWSTIVQAISEGLFSENEFPFNMGVFFKKISTSAGGVGSNGCWKVDAAAIDIQMPLGSEGTLEKYLEDFVYPKLSSIGNVGLHFGKYIPYPSSILQSAVEFYENCGAAVGLDPSPCYHPLCKRNNGASVFQYPSDYFGEKVPSGLEGVGGEE